MPAFSHDGLQLHYEDGGEGPPLVLLHGLLWSSRMFVRLRRMLEGYRVILLDLRGHGSSDRPTDPERYSWSAFASDVAACVDHLGLDRAVVGGLSLGANVTLATALEHTDRCAGAVIEMPVLERGEGFATRVFSALASAIERGKRPLRGFGRFVGGIPLPRRIPELAAIRDVAAVEPGPAAAVIRGLLADELPGHDPEALAHISCPTLVIGHRRDPLHVLDDAKELATNLPGGRFAEASSILEYRLHPDRLVERLRPFLDEVWEAASER